MYLVGLTGGIGSGKSTVAQRLAALGCVVIDADQVAREVVEPGMPVLDALVGRFGRGILGADGALDRSALAALAFGDETSRADLDRLTHPEIAGRIAADVARLAVERPDAIVVVDHPLLLETGQAGRFDAVVVVLADESTRVARLVRGRGMTEDQARARMRAQVDDRARRAAATFVLDNDGTREQLLAAVDELHARIAARAAAVGPTGRAGDTG